ncbi:replicative DNA helicase [Dietzia sp. UBA5065]|jgi:replicative DNA helicase|uniref:replicative DNA helicase n=1 Tax=Dietzia sp. UBA5065 TaxID=1946422 RepID=UPI0025BB038F|nr:replicative DNA helicase [Dietzia sp. UBA5065]HMT48564.1 replicative DNA helicase [Dietzia sp.]
MAQGGYNGPGEMPPPPDEGGSAEFGRTPPQDLTAEQSVLGGMLLSKDAIADVVEEIQPGDFYKPAHQAIYDVVLDLYARGEPADAVTVAAELERRGDLRRAGGATYLHTLISTVPTAANAGYYAAIVSEKAILRRLVDAGTRIVQYGYSGSEGADVTEVVDRAQAEIFEVTERRTTEDYVIIEELLQPTMDEIDAIHTAGGLSHGVPTGFADLDAVTNGLHGGQMIIIAARPGVGKALALDTMLPTPGGVTTMGEVAVGESVLGSDGQPTQVVAVTEVWRDRPCYTLRFNDGAELVADAEHEWRIEMGGTHQVVTTKSLETLMLVSDSGILIPEDPASGRADRVIIDVRVAASVPVRCIEVAAADHLYLAGPTAIPTHNSTIGLDIMRSCSIKNGLTSVVFSLEMSKTEIVMRLMSAEARVKLSDMKSGKMSDEDWTRMARRMGEISEAPLFIDDSPNLTMMEIRAKARRLKQKHDLRLIVVDYLQLMSSGKKVESRQQEVSEFSRQLKLLAKELDVPLIAISQLNRGPEQRTDKRPQVSDLRESGSLEQDADIVMLLHRPDATERDDPRAGEADLILGKHRGGPTSTITVAHQLHYSRFVDMARGL